VVAVNTALSDEPGLVNQDPYNKGWMIVIRMNDLSEPGKLISAGDYRALVKG
jgi:glycine cleavage system H protein